MIKTCLEFCEDFGGRALTAHWSQCLSTPSSNPTRVYPSVRKFDDRRSWFFFLGTPVLYTIPELSARHSEKNLNLGVKHHYSTSLWNSDSIFTTFNGLAHLWWIMWFCQYFRNPSVQKHRIIVLSNKTVLIFTINAIPIKCFVLDIMNLQFTLQLI